MRNTQGQIFKKYSKLRVCGQVRKIFAIDVIDQMIVFLAYNKPHITW